MSIAIAAAVRIVLVLLFLPFSALDKILNFKGAATQAREVVANPLLARAFIFAGLAVEIFMSAGVVSGLHDRLCAFVLAGYCVATALLWKRFWAERDFWSDPAGRGRGLFWDFLKNFALAGGFLLITFGTGAGDVHDFLDAPLSSTNPYQFASPSAP
jgi:putative oxidoreductase